MENNINEEKYSEFISLLELKKIDVESIKSNKNVNFPSKKQSLDIAIAHEVEKAKQVDEEIIMPVYFKVKAFTNKNNKDLNYEDISSQDTLFTIELRFNVSYFFDISEVNTRDIIFKYTDVLEVFAERNVLLNVWPYIRANVSDLTSKMGLPPLVLPLKKTRLF